MTQRQETTTDRLVSVIQSIQRGRKTGTLTARRGESITLEEGVVTFVNGQVAQVSVGHRVGLVALNWLSTWGYCRYTFISPPAAEIASPPTLPSPNISEDLKVTDSLQPLSIQSPTTARRPTVNQGATTRLEVEPEENAASMQTDIATHSSSAPVRTREPESALRVIERVGLSRAHRHLFLLVDGHRTMTEFARLIGKSEQELAELLDDLQRAGLVRVPGT